MVGIERYGLGGYMKHNEFLLKLRLQLFAEGAEPGAGSTGAEPGAGEPGNEPKTFDDVLKDKAYQSEFDKRIAKSLETAKSKWEAESQKKLEDATTEAAKLAKMNADQKAEYENQKKLDDLAKREKDINTRELKAQAYETLAEKGLPKELVEILNYSDAEQCNKSIEAVEKAFQSAVEKAVNDKLRGKGDPKGGTGSSDTSDASLRKAFGLK
jgi:hypothetical protein